MSRLEELIEKLCPDGVEIKKLEDVCIFVNGFAFKSNSFKSSGEPVIRITNIKNGFIDSSDIVYIDVADYTEDLSTYLVNKDEIVIAMSGATTGKVGINNTNDTFYLNQRVGKFIPKQEILNNHYLYHFLLAKQTYFYSNSGGGAQPNLSTKTIKETLIPIPPIKVQSEIVRILDIFTELTAKLTEKLTEELVARKKQYAFYLDNLFETIDAPKIPIKDLGTLTRGKRFVHADATELGVPCIHYGELYTYYGVYAEKVKSHIREDLRPKMRYAHKGDVVIVGAGENNIDIGIGVAWEGDEDVAVHDACYTLCHSQNAKYISYYLRSNMYHDQITKHVSRGKICSISATKIGEALIPIPSLEEQERIVSILDHFDRLCNDISECLPAEIEARQKQYEYYRDKLLTFNKAE